MDKKLISKQLLSQIHFCRFLYKLLKRIDEKINGNISHDLKEAMSTLIFEKLDYVKELEPLDSKTAREYKQSPDYEKISQIIAQYHLKYEKDLSNTSSHTDTELVNNCQQLERFQNELQSEIVKMYSFIKTNVEDIEMIKEEVIVLDYLVTLRQLVTLLQNNGLEGFHNKSKMEAIVDGAPSKNITREHVRAISAKLKAIKLL